MARLQLKLGGVRKMRRLPGAIFVVDPVREKIAVTEARRLEIPVIATGDTNVDPDMIDYIIPANDDAIRSIRLLCKLVADAAIEGMGQRAARAEAEPPVSGADVSDAETASDEMVAAVAAGGTYSFAPEPDEDEAVLPGEEAAGTPAAAASASEAPASEAPAADAAPAAAPEAPAAEAPAETPTDDTSASPEAAAEPAAGTTEEKQEAASAEAKA
jgi:small subunit ribosomal protein S2